MDNFEFFVPLQKGNENTLHGIASTLSIDRDEEKMSENALRDMEKEILMNGVNLFGNHQHDWENTLGVIKSARVNSRQLDVDIDLDNPRTNPKVVALLEKIKKGIKLGLSVGGAITKEREEYDRDLGKKVKVIDGVKLFEISVVGIPSNSDSFLTLPQAISKSAHRFDCKCPICFSKMQSGDNCPLCFYKN
jgi:HK97 family phage prohead protease